MYGAYSHLCMWGAVMLSYYLLCNRHTSKQPTTCAHTHKSVHFSCVPCIQPDQLTRRTPSPSLPPSPLFHNIIFLCPPHVRSLPDPWFPPPPSPLLLPPATDFSPCAGASLLHLHPAPARGLAYRPGNVQHVSLTPPQQLKKHLTSPEALHLWIRSVCYQCHLTRTEVKKSFAYSCEQS